MTKRVLLAGSSFSAVPILQALKDAGLHVTVAGNLPDDPCHALGDASLYFDYTDKDALLTEAKKGGFDYIVPSCNDASYIACAHAAHTLGKPGYDSAANIDLINIKGVFRQYLTEHKFPVPRFTLDGDANGLNLPLLVKPVDSSGGKGVTKITDKAGLAAAVDAARKASASGKIVIEEFFNGTLHSHSAFFAHGKIHVDFFADEFCTVYPYQVNCSNHPSRLSDDVRIIMQNEMTRLMQLTGMVDGLMHTQFMTDGKEIRIIESMRRCPGDLYGKMIDYSTGFDHAAHFAAPFIGRAYPLAKQHMEKPVGRHTISVVTPMLAQDVSVHLPADKIRFMPLKTAGQRLDPSPYDKFGLLFIDYADRAEMLEKTAKLADFVTLNGKAL